MAKIFISYKRESLEVVEPIVNELKRHHFVWFDQTGIPGGSEWEEQINKALDTASAMVLMVTPAALASKWVQYEFHTALAKKVLVIPFMLESCELPAELRGLQALHLSDASTFEKFMDALPAVSRIWGNQLVPENALQASRTIKDISIDFPNVIRQFDDNLFGIPIHQTRSCKVYLLGKKETTLSLQDNYQLALQLTSRKFSLKVSAKGSYPQDEFVQSILPSIS